MATRPHLMLPTFLFLVARLIMLAGLPLEGLLGYGDLAHFLSLARLGWPYFDYWVEFPPVFPFLSAILYRLSGGSEHVYDYLLVVFLIVAQAAGLWIFQLIATRLYGPEAGWQRSWMFLSLVVCLPYSWWSFDALAVTSTLLGIFWLLEGRDGRAGLALGIGILTKWFPGLALILAWRLGGLRRSWFTGGAALGLALTVFLGLYLVAPENTLASLRSQPGKGSWETIWALIDGNFQTGNFGPEVDPLDVESARSSSRLPARLSPWLTLPIFVGAGLWMSHRSSPRKEREAVAFLGIAWCLFLMWLPGYSPQWVLYLLPLCLLALPERQALLVSTALVLVNLLEWPVLLSRGLFWGLWLTVPLRAVLHLLVAAMFWQVVRISQPLPTPRAVPESREDAWARG